MTESAGFEPERDLFINMGGACGIKIFKPGEPIVYKVFKLLPYYKRFNISDDQRLLEIMQKIDGMISSGEPSKRMYTRTLGI